MSTFNRLAGSLTHPRARRFLLKVLLILLVIAPYGSVLAHQAEQTGQTGQTDNTDQTTLFAARVSLVEGEVNYRRADGPDKDWFDATLNLPLHEKDQIYSGPDGRAELQLSGRNIIRINHDTNLRFSQFDSAATQLALPVGTATIHIDSLERRQFQEGAQEGSGDEPLNFEIDSPVVAITLLKEGDYRVDVSDDGTTEVKVLHGQAEVYNQDLGTISVKEGRRFIVQGNDKDEFQVTKLKEKDDWDRWNDAMDEESTRQMEHSASHVPDDVPGGSDLDNYGDWIESSDYGEMWSPRDVTSDWAPYQDGYWNWYSPYGWRWISYERWGWAPYHYGRWVYWRDRWCWVPRATPGAVPGYRWRWAPHLAVFARDGRRNWMGWCPLGPGEAYHHGIHTGPIESLRNYRSPGGLSVIQGRQFDQGRVIVGRGALIARSRLDSGGGWKPLAVNANELKPPQKAPTRTAQVEKAGIARRLEVPVVMRRAGGDGKYSKYPGRTLRSNDGTGGGRASREGIARPSEPIRTGEESARPVRRPDYRPVERTAPPARDNQSPRNNERPAPPPQPAHPVERPAPVRDNPPPRNIERPSSPSRPSSPPPQARPSSAPQASRSSSPSPSRSSSSSSSSSSSNSSGKKP